MSAPAIKRTRMVDAALAYTLDGIPVFPVSNVTKQPLVPTGFKAASTDWDQIQAWWSTWPQAMIGVPTSAESRIWVLDVDPGREGSATLAKLFARYGELPANCVRTRTGGGGRHYVFKLPAGVPIGTRAGDIGPGLDTRGARADGRSTGYIVAPPSLRADGRNYEFTHGDLFCVTEAPHWLLFLATFSKGKRERLAAVGITGPEGFAGAPPERWHAIADEKIGRKRATVANPADWTEDDRQAARHYCDVAAERECAKVSAATEGHRDDTINVAAISIAGLIKGLADIGVDAGEDYEVKLLGAAAALGGDEDWIEIAREKFERVYDVADPRSLDHLRRDPARDFADVVIEPDAKTGTKVSTPSKLHTVRLSDVQAKNIRWLWQDRMAIGMSTMIAGPPKTGKSTFLFDMIARITRGAAWPGGAGHRAPKGSVILLSSEDALAETVLPRIVAAGGDPAKVHVVRSVAEKDGGRRAFNLKADLAALEGLIKEVGDVVALVVDPVTSYLGKVDGDSNSDVRSALDPLSEFADRLGIAVICNHHFRKGRGGSARDRINGSMAYSAIARANFVVVPDPEDAERRLFLDAGGNIARLAPGLAYSIEETRNPDGVRATRVVWSKDAVSLTADEAVRASDREGDDGAPVQEAAEFLTAFLSDGPKAVHDVKLSAKIEGHAWRTVERAKKKLGVVSEQQRTGGWIWRLKDAGQSMGVGPENDEL